MSGSDSGIPHPPHPLHWSGVAPLRCPVMSLKFFWYSESQYITVTYRFTQQFWYYVGSRDGFNLSHNNAGHCWPYVAISLDILIYFTHILPIVSFKAQTICWTYDYNGPDQYIPTRDMSILLFCSASGSSPWSRLAIQFIWVVLPLLYFHF